MLHTLQLKIYVQLIRYSLAALLIIFYRGKVYGQKLLNMGDSDLYIQMNVQLDFLKSKLKTNNQIFNVKIDRVPSFYYQLKIILSQLMQI